VGNIGHRSPPGSRGELGWGGCAPGVQLGRNLAPLGRWVLGPVARGTATAGGRWPVAVAVTGDPVPGGCSNSQ
jgi:hypothetical protein